MVRLSTRTCKLVDAEITRSHRYRSRGYWPPAPKTAFASHVADIYGCSDSEK